MKNYIQEVLKTNSPQFNADKVDLTEFESMLNAVIQAGIETDRIKKILFAGKGKSLCIYVSCHHIARLFPNEKMGIDIIHSILGIITEAGELAELLKKVLDGEEFDPINFKEEIGDSFWYDGIGLAAVQSSFDEAQERNIAKLRRRYKKQFTSEESANRNLSAEREALEWKDPNAR